jgi:hypothetical protein
LTRSAINNLRREADEEEKEILELAGEAEPESLY